MTSTTCSPLAQAGWFWKKRDPNLDIWKELDTFLRPADQEQDSEPPSATRDSISKHWYPTKDGSVPSEIHVELVDNGVIPNPFVGFGEHEVQWIAGDEWLYACTFSVPSSDQEGRQLKSALLTFEGLDTICDIYLNGQQVLKADNMFRAYEYQLPLGSEEPGVVKSDNLLLLHFQSAKALAKELEKEYGKVRAGSTNLGDPSRVYVRKAQYGWRWDWGPELMTCGPYRPITLTTTYHPVRVEDVWIKAWLHSNDIGNTLSYTPALGVDVTLDLKPELGNGYRIEISLLDPELPDQGALKTQTLPIQDQPVIRVGWPDLTSERIAPWWPVGLGNQKLYDVEIRLLYQVKLVQAVTKRTGFRSVRLIEDELQESDQYGKGTTFLFEVNGERVFMGGSNWIPADNFLTTLSEKRYRDWLTLVRDGNQNMVRIWGGGIYEPDVFYDLCDELGLLVWQDFQFACGVYPGIAPHPTSEDVSPKPYPPFVESVRNEAEYNLKRLRHHPSIAVWCGNNEDYQMVLQWGDVAHLPATIIYEDVLPTLVTALTSFSITSDSDVTTVAVPYVRGSPYGGKGWDTADPTTGDVHQWNIWGGKELPYQEYGRLGGRFVSEFGIPSFPSLQTVEYWMQGVDKSEWYAQSKAMGQHIRAGAYERRFAIVMNENFRHVAAKDFNKYRFNTQVMQSEAVGYAYQVWKREWRGRGKEFCGGVLVWQFNDCWPVTSWSLVDYFMRPKPIYYTISRRLAPVTVDVLREVVQNRDNDRPKQFYEYGNTRSRYAKLQVWATNTTREPIQAKLDLQFFDLNSAWSSLHRSSLTFTLKPNQSQDLVSLVVPAPPVSSLRSSVGPGVDGSGAVVVLARLLDPDSNEVLARFVDWPQPFRYLHIPDPNVSITIIDLDGDSGDATIEVAVEKPVKCLWLEGEYDSGDPFFPGGLKPSQNQEPEVKWSDNALDVVPGDPQVVVAKGLGHRGVKSIWLTD
ncbi:beta-mannosidase [Coprinopsis marcescibilis]|uniref:Beta-mannosidase B n=1 Tax=Coprinopsis marcescibilis TaxID=230819 RepID=A0A5C3KQA1_COPMA|nr:beta-mannosidase [Coprinopsis marcescibilis]